MEPDIPESGGAEQGVAESVDGDIAVRMGDASFGVRDLHASEDEPQPVVKCVHVVTVPDSEIRHNIAF